MGTKLAKGGNWQAEPVIGQGSRQESAMAVRVTIEAIDLEF
jgi:hypothetical protein